MQRLTAGDRLADLAVREWLDAKPLPFGQDACGVLCLRTFDG